MFHTYIVGNAYIFAFLRNIIEEKIKQTFEEKKSEKMKVYFRRQNTNQSLPNDRSEADGQFHQCFLWAFFIRIFAKLKHYLAPKICTKNAREKR
jgi:hypothetical protein